MLDTKRLLKVALVVSVVSFAFGYALIPLYRIACEQVFGIRLDSQAATTPAPAYAVDEKRTVTVEFDGTVNSRLPWRFHPNQRTMTVHPGQPYDTTYFAANQADYAIVGSAVPSVAPAEASAYFIKTECFCFTQQQLASGEQRDMPVRFVIDPDLPENIKTITLSYTFLENTAATEKLLSADEQRSDVVAQHTP